MEGRAVEVTVDSNAARRVPKHMGMNAAQNRHPRAACWGRGSCDGSGFCAAESGWSEGDEAGSMASFG